MTDPILKALQKRRESAENPPFRLHGGVRGAHPSRGGTPTPPEDLEGGSREHVFGPEATFVQGPEGRDSMLAGGDVRPVSKPHEDTTPWRTRPRSEGNQLSLTHASEEAAMDPSFRPTDVAQHVVRLKHPHLGNDYELVHTGGDTYGHEVRAYHWPGGKPTNNPQGDQVSEPVEVGYLRWTGKRTQGDSKSGEIQGVSVHPDHRGKELSTAMWDYAQVKVATHGIQEPIHSSDRSTAGNHWAHFVGGASYAREEGQHADEYFKGEWTR